MKLPSVGSIPAPFAECGQVMCAHDAEKLAISVLEIYDDGYHQE
jgi:hypothetical protein